MTERLMKLQNQTPKIESLLAFGFRQEKENFIYTTELLDNQFTLTITITRNGQISTAVVDNESGENYVLHQIPGAQGAFVGKLREEYDAILEKIGECFEIQVFQSPWTKRVIQYVREKYQDELEFLWAKFPDNAVFRRSDNRKWYAVILTVQKEKLGLKESDKVEILDLRMEPDQLAAIIDGKRYFPGWHMNKKHWVTICLDGSVDIEEIFQCIDASYILAAK